MADERSRVACVVVTYDALPWIEQCLASVAGTETVVVDNGSTDGTVDARPRPLPRRPRDRGRRTGASPPGWNRGIAETRADHVLVLNADAWLVEDALARLVAVGRRHPRAAVVGPRLLNPDGTLQRSVRGFPTLWRLATEYLFLRKLAPRSRALNAFYGAGFDHESEREVEWVMGACMLVRRGAFDEVGPFDERFFLFSEEVDWMRRAADRGWTVRLHARGALRPRRRRRARRPAVPRERPRPPALPLAPRAPGRGRARAHAAPRRRYSSAGRLYRGQRARLYREVAAWLGSGDVDALLAR